MIHRSIRPLIASACLFSTAALAFGQGDLVLKPALRTGEEFTYSFGMVLNVEQQVGDAAPQLTLLKSSAKIRFKVVEASPEGTAKLEGHFERGAVDAPIGEQSFGFDWPFPAPLPEDAPAIKKLGATLEQTTLHIEVDKDGRATVTGGLEKFASAAEAVDAPDERYVGFFTQSMLSQILTPIFRMDDAIASPRAVGKAWQSVELIPLPPVGALETVAELTVNVADSDVVEFGGPVHLGLKTPEKPAEDIAAVSLDPQESNAFVALVFDRHRYLLKQRKLSLGIATEWSLGGTVMKQRQLTVLNIRLVDE